MSKRQLLFVAYNDGNFNEGMSYAIELAKAMSDDIVMLLVRKKDTVAKKFENLMAGAAFAEEGEHGAARELAAGLDEPALEEVHGSVVDLIVQAGAAGVHLDVQRSDREVVPGIREFLRESPGIDKVVLSPCVTESEMLTTRELNRLVRTASRPIVTMTRQSVNAMNESCRTSKEESPYRYEPSVSF